MLHVCPKCGRYAPELSFAPDGVRCPFCGEHTPIRRYPLFLITGASCAGKSTVTRELYLHDSRVAAIESDILWDERWREMGDNFRAYRAMWLRLCQNISHAGKPVVLCGCCDPSQFAGQPEAGFFYRPALPGGRLPGRGPAGADGPPRRLRPRRPGGQRRLQPLVLRKLPQNLPCHHPARHLRPLSQRGGGRSRALDRGNSAKGAAS